VVVSGLQNRLELPAFEGSGYPDAYLSFLRTVVFLRTLGIAEERLLRLWHLEKTLLQLLHVDSTGSKTWFLDSCGAITRRDHRLLLNNYDIGIAVPAHAIQLGLTSAQSLMSERATPAGLFHLLHRLAHGLNLRLPVRREYLAVSAIG